mgnify:FL=1
MAYTDINSEDRLVRATFAEQAEVSRFSSGMAYPFGQQTLLEHT